MAGKPTSAFYLAVVAVVVGLVGFAIYRADIFAPKGEGDEKIADIDPSKLNTGDGAHGAEAADTAGITTVKEYNFVPAERLPPVKGTADYQEMEDNTVRFALNVWAGWAPIILANEGFKAGKVWKTADGKDFKVKLVLIDNPVTMRDAYAGGQVHIGWATLDMVPLFLQSFVDDQGKLVGLTGQKGLMEYVAEHFPGEVMVQRVGEKPYTQSREGA